MEYYPNCSSTVLLLFSCLESMVGIKSPPVSQRSPVNPRSPVSHVSRGNAQPSVSIEALSAEMHPFHTCVQPSASHKEIRVNPSHPRRSRAATSEKIRAVKFLSHLADYKIFRPFLNLTALGEGAPPPRVLTPAKFLPSTRSPVKIRSPVCKMGKEFLAADFSLTRCYAARCERGWNGLTRISFSHFFDGAQAHRRYAPCGNADGAGWWSTPNKLSFSRENVVTRARLLRSPGSPVLP